jgi:hypothetical protein
MNPLARLSPALYTALSGLVYAGVSVPVYEQPNVEPPAYYVLLARPKVLSTTGRASCRQWYCEVVIQVMTKFPSRNVDATPADAIADLILLRLDGQRLPMADRWDCLPGQLESLDDEAEGTDEENHIVPRRLRLRWLLSYMGPATGGEPSPFVRLDTIGRVRLVH